MNTIRNILNGSLVLISLNLSYAGFCQENLWELMNLDTKSSYTGGNFHAEYKSTKFHGKDAAVIGSSFGWTYNHSLQLGLSVQGINPMNSHKVKVGTDDDAFKSSKGETETLENVDYNFISGGVFLGYNLWPMSIVNITPRMHLGLATQRLAETEYGKKLAFADRDPKEARQSTGSGFVVEPEVLAEVNITKVLRLGFGFGYRYVYDNSSFKEEENYNKINGYNLSDTTITVSIGLLENLNAGASITRN